jgi:hypothetical protein
MMVLFLAPRAEGVDAVPWATLEALPGMQAVIRRAEAVAAVRAMISRRPELGAWRCCELVGAEHAVAVETLRAWLKLVEKATNIDSEPLDPSELGRTLSV